MTTQTDVCNAYGTGATFQGVNVPHLVISNPSSNTIGTGGAQTSLLQMVNPSNGGTITFSSQTLQSGNQFYQLPATSSLSSTNASNCLSLVGNNVSWMPLPFPVIPGATGVYSSTQYVVNQFTTFTNSALPTTNFTLRPNNSSTTFETQTLFSSADFSSRLDTGNTHNLCQLVYISSNTNISTSSVLYTTLTITGGLLLVNPQGSDGFDHYMDINLRYLVKMGAWYAPGQNTNTSPYIVNISYPGVNSGTSPYLVYKSTTPSIINVCGFINANTNYVSVIDILPSYVGTNYPMITISMPYNGDWFACAQCRRQSPRDIEDQHGLRSDIDERLDVIILQPPRFLLNRP